MFKVYRAAVCAVALCLIAGNAFAGDSKDKKAAPAKAAPAAKPAGGAAPAARAGGGGAAFPAPHTEGSTPGFAPAARTFGAVPGAAPTARSFGGANNGSSGANAGRLQGRSFVGQLNHNGQRMAGRPNGHLLRGERYRWPHGFAYRRWEIGRRLPSVFLVEEYFVDYEANGLEAPPQGAQWVRYGPDLLLVNLASGEVMQTAYGAYEPGPGEPNNAGDSSGGASSGPVQLAQAGLSALQAQNYARAIDLLSRAIDSGQLANEDIELALFSRGQAYELQGGYALAAQDLDAALQIKPDDSDAQFAFVDSLSKLPAPNPPIDFDAVACKKAVVTQGGALTGGGKSYSTSADFAGVDKVTAFAGLYRAISAISPDPVEKWQIINLDLKNGIIIASVSAVAQQDSIRLEAHVTANGSTSIVTMNEKAKGFLPLIDIKGAMCKTIAGLAH